MVYTVYLKRRGYHKLPMAMFASTYSVEFKSKWNFQIKRFMSLRQDREKRKAKSRERERGEGAAIN